MASQGKQDAIKLLTEDHRRVEELFKQFEGASRDAKKEQLARQICLELKVHAMLEEEIFYPALRGKIEDDDLDEALVEHDGAKMLINEIEAGGPDEQFYDAKVKVLQEQIEHHIKEEEKQSENIFSQARKADVDLDALGEQMAARKMELMQQADTVGLAPAQPTTMQHEATSMSKRKQTGWDRNTTVAALAGAAVAAFAAALLTRRWWNNGGEEEDHAPALNRSRPEGFVGTTSSARQAGTEQMRDPPASWDKVDEASDESFPASDPTNFRPHVD